MVPMVYGPCVRIYDPLCTDSNNKRQRLSMWLTDTEGITFCIRVTPIHFFFLPSLAHRRRRPALPSHSLQQIFIPFTSLLSLKYQTIPIHTKDYSALSYFPFILPCKDQRHSLQRPSSHNCRSGPTRRPLLFRTYIQPCTLISSSEFYSQFPLQVRPKTSQKKSSSNTFELSFHIFLDPFLTTPNLFTIPWWTHIQPYTWAVHPLLVHKNNREGPWNIGETSRNIPLRYKSL